MDRQKTIPPLSTKITRKLAQESADHNTLMNFYSQISRDETGAPKKWKMSTTLHIDEDSIKSKKSGIGKGTESGSNKGTPTNSRENSNERKALINSSLQKTQKSGRKSRDGSSSDQNSSRESSLESKSDDKNVKKLKVDKTSRSSSADLFKPRKKQATANTSVTDTGKKKRGPRPRSLDLSSKAMANGDDDNFKSPDPLTPCNIAVKRKKGRPKETPPVLYAEPPVEPSPVESLIDYEDTEDSNTPFKRGPGRPKKVKVFRANQLKSINKNEKLKSFNMKRYEGRGLKRYGSKLIKSSLPKGFRRMAKLPKLKPAVPMCENDQSDVSMDVESEESKFEMKENGMSEEKRRPGRPPGAKNKKYFGPTSSFITRAKAVKPRNKTHVKIAKKRGPGRPPGARNKTTLQKLADNVETVSNSSKENSVVQEKEENAVPLESEIQTQTDQDSKLPFNAIDEAIESVVFKARNDISLESNIKPRVPFRSSTFYKKKISSVKSIAKLKKEKDKIHKIRKKRILNVYSSVSVSEYENQMENLASNDLRRKLHSKLIQKLSSESKVSQTINEVAANANAIVQSIETNEKDCIEGENKVKSETDSVLSRLTAEEIARHCEEDINIPPAKIEEKTVLKPDIDKSVLKPDGDKPNDNLKIVRKQSNDITKFSDTESVCSELSTNSFGSVKRNIEKQVFILGEANLDSDDQTVRTRQRFEIIPGKKRKRTLSGEFDLLDEKLLRKEKRKVEKVQTDDESESNPVELVMPIKKPLFKKKKSPLKRSPNLKVKEGKIVKKYVSQLTAYRNRMLKQSPFLSRVRRRRRKRVRKGMPDSLLDSVKKPKIEMVKDETPTVGPNPEAVSEQLVKNESTADVALESVVMKSENYRKGLFEKFTDVTLENKADLVAKIDTSDLSKKQEQEDVDSDDTECTIELKDEIFSEDQDEMPIEESVDDSDTIDFHAEADTESSGKELYTESEIEIREMLFDLIDEITMKCESKNNQHTEIMDTQYFDDTAKVKLSNETSLEKTYDKNKGENMCKESIEENSAGKMIETPDCNENKNANHCDGEKELLKCNENSESTSEQNADTDKSNAEKKDNQVSESLPNVNTVVEDINVSKDIQSPSDNKNVVVENAEGQSRRKYKIKRKVRKGKFGPKPLSKKEPGKVVNEIKVRKKPGRKPKQKIGEDVALNNDIDAKPQNKRKTSTNESKSPETGVTRKFELRQKISRSPLDNIALKQSIEENVYLRNEAQKASRKEAKQRTKAKVAVQDSLESLASQSKEIETVEKIVPDVTEQAVIETQVEKEVTTETVDDLLKTCKPCKVVLKDFIRELERTQEGEESSYESELEIHEKQDNSDGEKGAIANEPPETVNSVSLTVSNEITSEEVVETSVTDERVAVQVNDELTVHETTVSIENATANSDSYTDKETLLNDNVENKLNDSSENKTVENSDSLKEDENNVTDSMGDMNDNNKKDIDISYVSPDIKQRELRPKRKTPVKMENISSPKLAVNSPKKVRKGKCMTEQQTARKTVPPLKIKLKGGFSSRRKTYIVEPSPDSPVEHDNKSEQKIEKKKDKGKTKSGNKSESDSEKHSKSHHHHKKRNKTPTEEVNSEQSKPSATQITEIPSSAVNVLSEKSAIRATDAYEATFLQFIQDKDKVEQNLAAFSSSLGTRSKPMVQNVRKPLLKDGKINNMTVRSTSLAVNSAKVAEENVFAPVNNDSQNDVEHSEVQYVCSQCDNVVYKAKEQIIQHYRDVHPGSQFIYKPLPDTAENITPATEPSQDTLQTEQNVDYSPSIENNTEQECVDENDQSQDDEDSGSLNLKIVDVVSLKDQQNILDDDADTSKEQVTVVDSMPTSHIQTELRIPSYPIPSSAPPPYPTICGPPPPYSVATGGAPVLLNSVVQEVAQLKQIPVPVKPKSQVKSGKIGSSFKCEKCNVHAPMLAAMVAHLRNSHREIPRLFQCPYCKDMEAETEAMIHQHIKKHHPTNNPNPPVALSEPAKRNLKTLSVRLPEGIKLGEGNSIEKDIYMCLRCKEHMPSLETIYEHLEHDHAEVFAYVCPVCKVFKSKTEDLVNNHIITDHRRSPVEVNVSLAIDGNHFVRVQCLIKEKTKSGQKASQSVSQKPQISPVPNVMQLSNPAIQVLGQAAGNVIQLQPIPQAVIPQEGSVPSNSCATVQSLNALQQQTNLNVSAPSVVSKQAAPSAPKKKKSLLESIQKIKDQKLEQQGLLPQKVETLASQIIPSHPSQLSNVKPNNAPGGVPPPLMRGPPPLIRYDQVNKVPSAQSAMFGSTVRTSTQFTLQNQTGQTNLQRPQNITGLQATQSITSAKPIQSSLFDTSDLDPVKSAQSQRPVLNVPVVSRLANKSPFSNSPPANSTPEGTAVVTTGTPLDLSKTTPTGSPAPQNVQSTNPGQVQLSSGGINPDVFQVFNLRPSTQIQLPRQQVPVQQMIAQPIMLPQQVRQNTPSTLAYRPGGPQMLATSQVQQIIGMPVATAVLGNMVVSLGNVPQGVANIPGVTQIPSLQNAQFVRMTSPQMPVSAVTVLNSSETSAAATQAQPKTAVTGQQVLSKNMLFKCPYCPNLTPLRLDQVQPHIENKHRGSTILFKPFDSR